MSDLTELGVMYCVKRLSGAQNLAELRQVWADMAPRYQAHALVMKTKDRMKDRFVREGKDA